MKRLEYIRGGRAGVRWVVIRMIGVCQYTIDLVQCTCRYKVNRLSGTGWFICGARESNTERGSTEHAISRCCIWIVLDLLSLNMMWHIQTLHSVSMGNAYIEGW